MRRAIVKVVGSEVRQGKREGFSYWVPVDGDTEMEAVANAKVERIRMGAEVVLESVTFLGWRLR
jgi:hypothetical protein